jgi:hypothetical protein
LNSVLFSKGRALILNPFLRLEHLCDREFTYFKSAGLREIEFPGIVKASLQLGKTAKSPQTSNPAPGWRICGDLAHFAPTRKRRATKIASFKTAPDCPPTSKKQEKV